MGKGISFRKKKLGLPRLVWKMELGEAILKEKEKMKRQEEVLYERLEKKKKKMGFRKVNV